MEPSSFGKRFTWTNGQVNLIWVKLDHFLVNSDWSALYPCVIQNCLSHLGLDHVPIRLEFGDHSPTTRLFRFEQTLCSVDHFPELISDWWSLSPFQGCGAFILAKKIARIRTQLKPWAKFDFGSIKFKKLALLHDLELLDSIKETRPLTDEEINKDLDLRIELWQILNHEEVY